MYKLPCIALILVKASGTSQVVWLLYHKNSFRLEVNGRRQELLVLYALQAGKILNTSLASYSLNLVRLVRKLPQATHF